jgi:hypothetical protein
VLPDQTTFIVFNNDTKPATVKFKLSDAGLDPRGRYTMRHDGLGRASNPGGRWSGDDVEVQMSPRSVAVFTAMLDKN